MKKKNHSGKIKTIVSSSNKKGLRDESSTSDNDSLKSLKYKLWDWRSPVNKDRCFSVHQVQFVLDLFRELNAENIILTSILKQKKSEVMKVIDDWLKDYPYVMDTEQFEELKSKINEVFGK